MPLKEHELQEGHIVFLGVGLSSEEAKDILAMIRGNVVVFAWRHSDVVGVDP